MLMQGKNAGNPDGLPSILTWQKRKLTIENRGSDNFCHPKGDLQAMQKTKSIMGIFSLDLTKPIKVEARGEDCSGLVEELKPYIQK